MTFETAKQIFFEKAKEKLGETYNSWYGGLDIKKIEDNIIYFTIDSQFKLNHLKKKHLAIFKKICSVLFETDIEFDFCVISRKTEKTQEINVTKSQEHSKPIIFSDQSSLQTENSIDQFQILLDKSGISSEMTFENFYVSQFNQSAYKVVKNVISKFGLINPLYIYGNVGLGKTHLMNAIGLYYLKKFPYFKVYFLHPTEFVSEYVYALKHKKENEFRYKYSLADVLLIDDTQFFLNKEQTIQEFFTIFNKITQRGKQIILTSDRLPHEMKGFHDRLKSRLNGSAIVRLEDMEVIDKKQILAFYLKQYQLILNKDALDYIVCVVPGDIRSIKGVVKTLLVHKSVEKVEIINFDFCKNCLTTLEKKYHQFDGDKLSKLSANEILLETINYNNLTLNSINSESRSKRVVECRQVIMYLLKYYKKMSLAEIGRTVGGRNASTVLSSLKKIEREISINTHMQQTIDNIIFHIQQKVNTE